MSTNYEVPRCATSSKAGKRQSIKTANRSFESAAKFKYLVTTLTDQNCIHEEITQDAREVKRTGQAI
jgi:hypothetical protein